MQSSKFPGGTVANAFIATRAGGLLAVVLSLGSSGVGAADVPRPHPLSPAASAAAGGTSAVPLPAAKTPARPAIPPTPPRKLSDAEKVASLRNSLEEDQRTLKKLADQLADPRSEYEQAQQAFRQIDRQVVEKTRELQKRRDQPDAAQFAEELKTLEKPRQLAKDRFDLAIKDRKSLQLKVATLEQKIATDKTALDKLTGETASTAKSAGGQSPLPGSTLPLLPTPGTIITTSAAGTRAVEPAGGEARPAPTTTASAPLATAIPAATTSAGTPASSAPPKTAGTSKKDKNPELERAKKEAAFRLEAAREAAADEESLSARIEGLNKTIELERESLATARQKCDNAEETEADLLNRLNQRMAAGAARAELDGFWQKVNEARQRFHQAQDEVQEQNSKLDELQSQLATLQSELMQKREIAEQKRHESDQKQKELSQLENPFALHNIARWLLQHGPNLCLICAGILLLSWCTRLFSHRIFGVLVRGVDPNRISDRQARANTLTSVFENACAIAVRVGGFLMICEEVDLDVKVLLGSVGVVGLAVAFGAQNLIKDYFNGFMILLENQYAVNDVVTIGTIRGQVEQVTLRLTVLRDREGHVHFIPNGQINTVTNHTLDWARAVFEIGIAYKENVDTVVNVLRELCQEFQHDPKYAAMILEPATHPGVEQLGDSAVVLKFHIKTRPLKQGEVKQELLRRIKNRFDELGIEIPFPHRTIYHVHAPAALPGNSTDAQRRLSA